MKKSKNYFGDPLTMRKGPHPCRGSVSGVTGRNTMQYTHEQVAWMKENKPLYYTGDLFKDIHHLPPALRSL